MLKINTLNRYVGQFKKYKVILASGSPRREN